MLKTTNNSGKWMANLMWTNNIPKHAWYLPQVQIRQVRFPVWDVRWRRLSRTGVSRISGVNIEAPPPLYRHPFDPPLVHFLSSSTVMHTTAPQPLIIIMPSSSSAWQLRYQIGTSLSPSFLFFSFIFHLQFKPTQIRDDNKLVSRIYFLLVYLVQIVFENQ